MADNTIDIRVDVEGNAAKQLNRLGDSVEKFEKTSTKSFSSARRAFEVFSGTIASQAVGAGFRAASRAAGEFFGVFKQGIRLAQIQEDAINELNTALRISGKFSKESSESLQDFASQLQQTTKFGDETILKTQALIQSLGQLDEEGLKGATQAAVDLSAALGVDLNAAALLVGKAASGEVSSFSRYGLIIEKSADKSQTFANALEAINSKFGGAAAAQVNTFSGAVAQLSNTYGDTLEVLGQLVTGNENFSAVVKVLNDVFLSLQGTIKTNEDQIKQYISDGIFLVINTFQSKLIPLVAATEITFLKLSRAASQARGTLNAAFAVLGSDDAEKQALASASAVNELNKRIEELENGENVYTKLSDATEEFKNRVSSAAKQQRELNQALVETPVERAPQAVVDLEPLEQAGPGVELSDAFIDQQEALTLELIEKSRERESLLADLDEQANKDQIAREQQKQSQLTSTLESGGLARLKVESSNKKRSEEIEQQRLNNIQNFNTSFFGSLSSLQRTKSRELFAIGKAAALAEATVSGALAVQKAFASVPFPLNFAAAAAVGVKSAVQIATIAGTEFKAQSGLTQVPSGFPNDTFPARLTSGERVVSAEQNRDLRTFLEANQGLSERIDALAVSISESQSRPIQVQVDGATILDVVQEQIDSGRVLQQ